MAAITKLINLYFSDRLREIDYFREHPAEVQERQFRYLLANGAKTEFGRDLGMKGIATQQQFRDRIPIYDYETISEFIDRTRRGERHVLWPEEAKWSPNPPERRVRKANTSPLPWPECANPTCGDRKTSWRSTAISTPKPA